MNYEPGSDAIVSDATNGQIKLVSSIQPGPGGEALDASKSSIVGLRYVHLPQFPSITTAAQSLDGGTDGTEIGNSKLYDEFASAYETLENYDVQIVVPMGATLDGEKDNEIKDVPGWFYDNHPNANGVRIIADEEFKVITGLWPEHLPTAR